MNLHLVAFMATSLKSRVKQMNSGHVGILIDKQEDRRMGSGPMTFSSVEPHLKESAVNVFPFCKTLPLNKWVAYIMLRHIPVTVLL